MQRVSRRDVLRQTVALTAAAVAVPSILRAAQTPAIRFGMVTYQWGRDWDLPTLLKNCQAAGILGVELRTTHKHGVEPTLSVAERAEVKARFADSPVKLVSIGSAEDFHSPDPAAVKRSIEKTREFLKLSADVGSSGVKVRPNDLPKGVEPQKTIEQIGKALNECGVYAADLGQQVRLEVHGGCSRPSVIKQIMDVATNPAVAVCWNSNNSDQEAPGLEANFMMLRPRMGLTSHVRQLDTPGYAWADLIRLFVKTNYQGWLLLEAGGKDPEDRVAAMIRQRELFEQLMARAMA